MNTLTVPTPTTDMDAMRIQSESPNRLRGAAQMKLAGKGMDASKIDAVANDFESQFISQMLENMFSTVDTNGILGGGEGEEVYRSMMIDQYGKLMSRAGGIGVADHVKREMLRMQEVSSATPTA